MRGNEQRGGLQVIPLYSGWGRTSLNPINCNASGPHVVNDLHEKINVAAFSLAVHTRFPPAESWFGSATDPV